MRFVSLFLAPLNQNELSADSINKIRKWIIFVNLQYQDIANLQIRPSSTTDSNFTMMGFLGSI